MFIGWQEIFHSTDKNWSCFSRLNIQSIKNAKCAKAQLLWSIVEKKQK